jgi:hypothetical protein
MNIDTIMRNFCNAGADAVSRYVTVSGTRGPFEHMPEYFMPAYMLTQLGDQMGIVLEMGFDTGFPTLIGWNADVRRRRNLPPEEHDQCLLRRLHGKCVDMVLFTGDDGRTSGAERDLLALVEFKNGWLDADRIGGNVSDRDKLLMFLDCTDTCPFGIVCGYATARHCGAQQANPLFGPAIAGFNPRSHYPGISREMLLRGTRV